MSDDSPMGPIAHHLQPDYGVILRWPQEGNEWIHPEDRALAESLIPGRRVFRRDSFDGEYYHFFYGAIRLRLKPCLWLRVASEDLEIDDPIEVLAQLGQADPLIGQVCEKLYDPHEGRIYYLIRNREVVLTREYAWHELQRLNSRPQLREPNFVHQPQKMGIKLQEVDPLNMDFTQERIDLTIDDIGNNDD